MRRILLLVVLASVGSIGVASAGSRSVPPRAPGPHAAGLARQMQWTLAAASALAPARQPPRHAPTVTVPPGHGYSCPAGLTSRCPARPCVRFIGAAGAVVPVATATAARTVAAVPQPSGHCGGARAPATRRVSLTR